MADVWDSFADLQLPGPNGRRSTTSGKMSAAKRKRLAADLLGVIEQAKARKASELSKIEQMAARNGDGDLGAVKAKGELDKILASEIKRPGRRA